jgi:hypothetical protein
MKQIFAICIVGIFLLLTQSPSFAGDEEIWGTYELIRENPRGYITYGKEGRMLVLITYDGRIKPQDALKTTIEERDALYRSMIAYGGTYTYSGNRIEHHVDISRNESQVGTTLVRNVSRDGDRLTYVTEPFQDGSLETLGKMVVNTLIWERMR